MIRTTLAAALLVVGSITLAAVPASAASGCIVRVTQVQALDLQEPPQDEIYFLFGDTRFPSGSVTMTALQGKSGTQFGNPQKFVADGATVPLVGWEADVLADDPLGTADLGCATRSPQDLVGPDSRYRVWFGQTPA